MHAMSNQAGKQFIAPYRVPKSPYRTSSLPQSDGAGAVPSTSGTGHSANPRSKGTKEKDNRPWVVALTSISKDVKLLRRDVDDMHQAQQSSLREVLSEIKSLKKDLHTLHTDHKTLQETLRNNTQFEVENSSYKNELWTKTAKAFCKSLTREVGESSVKAIVEGTLEDEDKGNSAIVGNCIAWCKKKLTSFRIDERRKLLGINSYQSYRGKTVDQLTSKMVRTMRATGDVAPTYKRHVALLRKYIHEHPTDTNKEGKLYSGFKSWVNDTYSGGAPDEEEWETILSQGEEDPLDRTLSPLPDY